MKRGVVILGMARSGTSLAANAFVAAGYYAGEPQDLVPADPFNPHGYYETFGIGDPNERLLRSLGRYWFAPPTADELAHASPALLEEVRRPWDRLLGQASDTPVVLKDPRIGVLLPVWRDMLGDLEAVLVVRDPVEIARSVGARDQVPASYVLAAWELHMKLLLRAFGGQTVTVMPFRRVLEQPAMSVAIVEAVTSRLGPEQQRAVNAELATEAVDQSLHRGRPSADQARNALTATQADLWQLLDRLPPGTQVLPDYPDTDDEYALETVQHWADRYSPIDDLNEARQLLHGVQQDLHEARVSATTSANREHAAATEADLRSQLARATAITQASLVRLADAYCVIDRMDARLGEEMTAHFETTARLANEMTAHFETRTQLANEMTARYQIATQLAGKSATRDGRTRRALSLARLSWLARLRR